MGDQCKFTIVLDPPLLLELVIPHVRIEVVEVVMILGIYRA